MSAGVLDVTDAFWRFVHAMNCVADTDDVMATEPYKELSEAVYDGRRLLLLPGWQLVLPAAAPASDRWEWSDDERGYVFDNVADLFDGATRLMRRDDVARAPRDMLARCVGRIFASIDAEHLADDMKWGARTFARSPPQP